MTYKLFIDDVREPTEGGACWWKSDYIVARNVKEAIEIITEKGYPQHMSLDHDLGEDETVMEFLHWLAGNYYEEGPPDYVVHSANPIGRDNIIAFMNSWDKSLNL